MTKKEISNEELELAMLETHFTGGDIDFEEMSLKLLENQSKFQDHQKEEQYQDAIGDLIEISICYYLLGDFKNAISHSLKAAHMLAYIDIDDWHVIALIIRAKSLVAIGDLTEALGIISEAFNIAQSSSYDNRWDLIFQVEVVRADIFTRMGTIPLTQRVVDQVETLREILQKD